MINGTSSNATFRNGSTSSAIFSGRVYDSNITNGQLVNSSQLNGTFVDSNASKAVPFSFDVVNGTVQDGKLSTFVSSKNTQAALTDGISNLNNKTPFGFIQKSQV